MYVCMHVCEHGCIYVSMYVCMFFSMKFYEFCIIIEHAISQQCYLDPEKIERFLTLHL